MTPSAIETDALPHRQVVVDLTFFGSVSDAFETQDAQLDAALIKDRSRLLEAAAVIAEPKDVTRQLCEASQ